MYPPHPRHDYHLPPPRLDSTPPSSSSSSSSVSPPLGRHSIHSPPSDSPPSSSAPFSNHRHHLPQHPFQAASRVDLMGRPIHFLTGQFAGKTIRASLNEVQKADLGRKYARVDRRPLDPPPVVQLRLFQVYHAGTDQETEQEIPNYDEVEVLGLMCTVDLFPVDSPDQAPRSRHHYDYGPNGAPYPRSGPPPRPQESRTYPYSFMSQPQLQSQQSSIVPPIMPLHVPNGSPSRRSPGSASVSSSYSSSSGSTPSSSSPASSNTSSDVIHRIGNQVLTEDAKLTNALVGATFVQPFCVDYQGRKALMFVFADLAVKIEGTFILRYRVFDIFSKPQPTENLPIQAECYGGMFRVYSTKEFPGLQASTELTKQLAMWGVRLNIRETERRRRRRDEDESPTRSP